MSSPADVLTVWSLGSPVDVKLTRFPDGQVNAIVDFPEWEDAVIKRSINSFDALQEVMAVRSALGASADSVTLYSPYILGGRSDRRFHENGTDYLHDVMGAVLNACDFNGVVTLDPHSAVMANAINGLRTKSLNGFHRWVYSQIGDAVVVSPDKGAVDRAAGYHRACGHDDWGVCQCEKRRDVSTGRILESVLPESDFRGASVLIVDDICDGGATFLELGKKIRDANCGKLYLAVTHGIFSKGVGELGEVFDQIFCTDSFRTMDGLELVSQYKL